MALKLSQKIGTTAVGVGLLITGAFVGAAPAQAAVDPFPTAKTCVVESDHVTVKLGSTGNSVKEAQCLLNRHGAKLVVDGKFGAATNTATRNFQKSKGLVVDGVIGVKTWQALLGSNASTPPSDPGRQVKVDKVIAYAKSKLGSRYVWGATGPTTFDCSGLTMRAYGAAGITTPRVSGDQAAKYPKVSKANAKPGDLMHWPGHVGIYAGNGKVYHASSSQGKVVLTNTWGSPTYHRVIK